MSRVAERVFVCGTLTDPARVAAVVGRPLPARPALLRGYVRHRPADDHPYVTADPAGTVDGLVLEDVDEPALRRLDAYEDEGRLYRREPAVAEVAGEPVACVVYVGAGIVGRRG